MYSSMSKMAKSLERPADARPSSICRVFRCSIASLYVLAAIFLESEGMTNLQIGERTKKERTEVIDKAYQMTY